MNNCEKVDLGQPSTIVAARQGLWALARPHAPVVGLVGVMIAFISIGSLFALQQAPFELTDEKAHVGYAHEVAGGSLPTIETYADVPSSAHTWDAEMNFTRVEANRTVWVANHPPLFYVSVAPLIWIADAVERSDGGLLYLRLANVVYGAIGIAFTYLLAKELTKSDRLALLAAAVTAMVAQLYAALSLAMSDGLAFAAGTAVTWAAVRCLQRGTTSPNLGILAAATAVATGARAVTMLVAFVAVGVVACFEYSRYRRHHQGSSRRSVDLVRGATRAATRVVLVGTVPAVVLFGWFYVRNVVLYGDIGASTYLLERFRRQPNGSVMDILLDADVWTSLWRGSMSPATFGGSHPAWMMTVAALGVLGLVVAVVTRHTGDRDADGVRYALARSSLFLLGSGIAVIVWYIAEHLSGGGYLHPRYLFPVVASVAVLLVVGLDRLLPRILPAVVLFFMGFWTLRQVPVGVDVAWLTRPRDQGQLPPPLLRTLPGSDFWRLVTAAGIVLGCVCAVAALAIVLCTSTLRPTEQPLDDPGEREAVGSAG